MPKLTDHFSLEEMTFSETAVRHGLDNEPDAASRKNLFTLCENMLEPIRELVGGPINVTSGFRSPSVNSVVSGSSNSQHMTGQAADVNCPLLSPQILFRRIRESTLSFDQLIDEFGAWVHVSYANPNDNRRQVLRARHGDNGPEYKTLKPNER